MALATNALTNVATLESILGLASGSADTKLQRAINQASAIAETYCGRIFYRDTAIAEKHPGNDSPLLKVLRAPLNSLTSVAYQGTAESSANTEVHDSDQGLIYRINGHWYGVDSAFSDASTSLYSGVGRKVWTITYDGGWYTPKQDDDDGDVTRNLPYDLEQAVIGLSIFLYRAESRDPTLRSETLMEASQTYAAGAAASQYSGTAWIKAAVPASAMILDRYAQGFFG